MTDDEIRAVYEATHPNRAVMGFGSFSFARAILAAHTAKLLAGVEMPESVAISAMSGKLYTADQLQQYAAAAAAQAREKALEDAKKTCEELRGSRWVSIEASAECVDAIEKLKGGE